MNSKKKQKVVITMTIALSMSIILSPIAVYAQEEEKGITQNISINEYKSAKESEVFINSINFPDNIFRKYVEDNFDTTKDGKLSNDEINNATDISFFTSDAKNITSLTGISYFTNLDILYCVGTKIENLDVSNNNKLRVIQCQVNPNLTSLTIGSNSHLTMLYCMDDIKLKNLDISQTPNLERLICGNTGIETLNLENNPKLTYLNCHHIKLTSLDVSKNLKLETIACGYSKLQGLDVSHNTLLEQLQIQETPFAWINIGTNKNIGKFQKTEADITIPLTGDTFDIARVFNGIDVEKINVIDSGRAILNTNTGIISGCQPGIPFKYEYDCGESKNGKETQTVTLNFSKSDSTILITDNMNQEYTGMPIATPKIYQAGSKGKVTFIYEIYNGSTWQIFNGIPTNAGKYKVQANLAGTEYYNEAKSEKIEFIISQATNSWIVKPAIMGWTYGEQAKTPNAASQFGDVTFSYSDSKDGSYTNKVPTDAGKWYLKANVTGTDNYMSLKEIIPLIIAPKNIKNSDIKITDVKNNKDVENLVIKDGIKKLEKDKDYEISKKHKDNKVIITIKFKGNYIGLITKSYMIENSKNMNNVLTDDKSHIGFIATLSILSAGYIIILARKKKNI